MKVRASGILPPAGRPEVVPLMVPWVMAVGHVIATVPLVAVMAQVGVAREGTALPEALAVMGVMAVEP